MAITYCMPRGPICCGGSAPSLRQRRATRKRWHSPQTTASADFLSDGLTKCGSRTYDASVDTLAAARSCSGTSDRIADVQLCVGGDPLAASHGPDNQKRL